MVCKNCGREIENGKMYCSFCGTEARLVPDYNELEEELLRIVADEPESEADFVQSKDEVSDGKVGIEKYNVNVYLISKVLIAAWLIVLLISIISVYSVKRVNRIVDERNENSFDFQYNLANEYYDNGDYENSLVYYKKAEILNPDDFDLKITIAHNYLDLGDTKSYRKKMDDILALNVNKEYVYKDLISFYDSQHMYDEIIDMCNELNDPSLLYMFEDYMVSQPTFSNIGGKFNHKFVLTISAANDEEIRYTLDGGDPKKNGILYNEGIEIDDGLTKIRAVAVNEKGVYSDEVSADFSVVPEPLKAPSASLQSGEYSAGAEILLHAESGCKIYYNWNSDIPTAESAEYTTPLEVPVGDNVLTIIAINNYGEISPIAQYHYYNQVIEQ